MKDMLHLLILLDANKVEYRQLSKSKLEIYTKSPVYDKVFFFNKTGKLNCTTWEDEFTEKIGNEQELIETIKRLERGFEL